MSERDNPTMQIAKTAKEVKRFQQQEIVARRARFGSKSAPGIARSTEWKRDELGNPTRQVGDVPGVDVREFMTPSGKFKWVRPRTNDGKFSKGDVE